MTTSLEFGLDTFGDVTRGADGALLPHAQVIRNVIEEGVLADRLGKERGWPPMSRDEFGHEADHGSLYVGSPKTVARKIAATVEALGVARFQLKYSAGPLPHEKLMRSIELYGTKVVPLVKEMVA